MTLERFTLRSAVYLLLFRKARLFLLRRYNTGWMDGKYTLIAGHLDPKETIFEAMKREAFEETGIKVKISDLAPVTVLHRKSTDSEYIDFFFVAKKWSGEPKLKEPEKCDDIGWFPLSNLPENMLPYIKKVLENYSRGIAFSSFGWK